MYEQLLILEPDQAQARRLGEKRVWVANVVGLVLGLAVAIPLIALAAA